MSFNMNDLDLSHEIVKTTEVCSLCEGSSIAWDDNPLLPEIKKCSQCNGTGLVESNIPMVGNEECYYCKDEDA